LPLSEAEQNRLIQANIGLVQTVAAEFRGKGNIPFEDLCAEGMVGLVSAARVYIEEKANFPQWAAINIRGVILDFIKRWEEFVPLDAAAGQDDKLIYEWQNSFFALYEQWESPPRSPDEIMERFETIASKRELISSAFLSLSQRERRMIEAYFVREPRVPLEQIARDERISYKKTTDTIYRALGKMREIIKRIEAKRREKATVIPFPAKFAPSFPHSPGRAGRQPS
jgi:RNA polymerase sigma factor (sigma-70 family)